VPTIEVKEYYIDCACEKIYAPPGARVTLFGTTCHKLASIGGVFNNSKYSNEESTAVLDNILSNWLDMVSSSRRKKRENAVNLVNECVDRVDKLKEEGFISNVL